MTVLNFFVIFMEITALAMAHKQCRHRPDRCVANTPARRVWLEQDLQSGWHRNWRTK